MGKNTSDTTSADARKAIAISLESKDYYSAREIIEAVAKAFQIDLMHTDEIDYNEPLEKNVRYQLESEIKKIQNDPSLNWVNKDELKKKDGKNVFYSRFLVRRMLDDETYYERLFSFPRKDAKERKEQFEKLMKEAKDEIKLAEELRENESFDELDNIQNDTSQINETIASEMQKRITDIAIDFVARKNKLDKNSPEYAALIQAEHNKAIEEEIRNRKIDIVMKYVFENFIDLDEELLEHDVSVVYTSSETTIEGPVRVSIEKGAAERLKDLRNYYKIKKPEDEDEKPATEDNNSKSTSDDYFRYDLNKRHT